MDNIPNKQFLNRLLQESLEKMSRQTLNIKRKLPRLQKVLTQRKL